MKASTSAVSIAGTATLLGILNQGIQTYLLRHNHWRCQVAITIVLEIGRPIRIDWSHAPESGLRK